MSRLVLNWVRLGPIGTNLWLFKISVTEPNYTERTLILKVPDWAYLGANLGATLASLRFSRLNDDMAIRGGFAVMLNGNQTCEYIGGDLQTQSRVLLAKHFHSLPTPYCRADLSPNVQYFWLDLGIVGRSLLTSIEWLMHVFCSCLSFALNSWTIEW